MDYDRRRRQKPTQEQIRAAQQEFLRKQMWLERYTPFDIDRQYESVYTYLNIHSMRIAVLKLNECIDRLTDRLMSLGRIRDRYMQGLETIAEESEEGFEMLNHDMMSRDRRHFEGPSVSRAATERERQIGNTSTNVSTTGQLSPTVGTTRPVVMDTEANHRIPRQLQPIVGATRPQDNPRYETRAVPAKGAFNEVAARNPTVNGRLPNVLGRIAISADEPAIPITLERQEEKDFIKRVYEEKDGLDISEKVKKILQFISERENREQMQCGR